MPISQKPPENSPNKGLAVLFLSALLYISVFGVKFKCIGCTVSPNNLYNNCKTHLQVKPDKPPKFIPDKPEAIVEDKNQLIRDLIEHARRTDKFIETGQQKYFDAVEKFNVCMTSK